MSDPANVDRRAILVGHARFARHVARTFRSPLLLEPDMAGVRCIEHRAPNLVFTLHYSDMNGCVLNLEIPVSTQVPQGQPEFFECVIDTVDDDFKPIRKRIRHWRSQFERLKAADRLDFRQASLIHALLHGFREPLRKGPGKTP